MSVNALFLTCTAVFLCACAKDRWPGQFTAPDRYVSAGDYPVVERRYNAASKKPLGTQEDVSAIKHVFSKSDQGMIIREIRWTSPLEVIIHADDNNGRNLGWISCYYIFEKRDDRWREIAYYEDFIAN